MRTSRFIIGLLSLSMFVPQAFAVGFSANDSLILSNPINTDSYAAGGEVRITSSVEGDLLVAGGKVSIDSDVVEDLSVAGGELNIKGIVGDDLRAIGGNVRIESIVSDHLVVVGGSVSIEPSTEVLGDSKIVGGDVQIYGTLQGRSDVYGERVVFGGTANQELTIAAKEVAIYGFIQGVSTIVADNITLEEGAVISQNIEYWSKKGEIDFSSALTNGAVASFNSDLKPVYTQQKAVKDVAKPLLITIVGLLIGFSLAWTIVLLIVFLWLYDTYFTMLAKNLLKEPLMSLLYGVLYIIGVPILCIILTITVAGIPIAAVLGLVWVLFLWFGKAIASLALVRAYQIKYKKKWGKVSIFSLSVGVYLILKLLTLIPLLGWLVRAVVVFAAIGALLMTSYQLWRKREK